LSDELETQYMLMQLRSGFKGHFIKIKTSHNKYSLLAYDWLFFTYA